MAHSRGLVKIGTLIRNGWLMVGITVALWLLLEGGLILSFRLWDDLVGNSVKPPEPHLSADTYPDTSWVASYYDELKRSRASRWKPYTYWRRLPFQGERIQIAPDGTRRTSRPAAAPGPGRPVTIFVFGGSTIWGIGARDDFTIPSLLVQELEKRGVASDVTNFGEDGYVSMQEAIALELLLREGRVPDLAIFYDGINDTYSAYQQRIAGLPENEFNRAGEFNLTKPDRVRERAATVLRDAVASLATTRLLFGIVRRVWPAPEVVPLAQSYAPGDVLFDADSLALAVIDRYAGTIELVRALGEHYGFRSLFYWQPVLWEKNHQTSYETARGDEMRPIEPFYRRTYAALRASRLSERFGGGFRDLSTVLSERSEPFYVDWCHLGEAGNAIIAREIAEDAAALLGARPPGAAADSAAAAR